MSSPEILTRPVATPQALDPTATAARLDAVADEAVISGIITEVTDEVERQAGVRVWYREYLERVEGGGHEHLYLGARPIVSVVSVADDSGYTVTEGSDYDQFVVHQEDGSLLRSSWPAIVWTVRYFAGWYLQSMADPVPTGAYRLEAERPSLAGAIFEAVKLTYEFRSSPALLKRAKSKLTEVEYFPASAIYAPTRLSSILAGIRGVVV